MPKPPRRPRERREPECEVRLRAIRFNHDPGSLGADAMNLRLDAATPVAVPEWVEGHTRPEESRAAYSLRESAGNTLTIQARFTIAPVTQPTAEVRARLGGILGRIDPFVVNFAGGVSVDPATGSDFVPIPLVHQGLHGGFGIRRQDLAWAWEYRCAPGAPWRDAGVSKHRIYAVLQEPPKPWSQADPAKYPWATVLDHACVRASGKADVAAAAKILGAVIYQSHGALYDNVGGAPSYTGGWGGAWTFDLTRHLGAIPAVGVVNCYDQASAMTAYGASVGCPMVFHYQGPFGYLRVVVPVGRGRCNNPFHAAVGQPALVGLDDPRTSFGNHAYGKMNGAVYDPCMGPPGGIFLALGQAAFEAAAIDDSRPFEAAASGKGVPLVPGTLTLS